MISRAVLRPQGPLHIDRLASSALGSSPHQAQFALRISSGTLHHRNSKRLYSTPVNSVSRAVEKNVEEGGPPMNGNGARKLNLHPAPKKVGLDGKPVLPLSNHPTPHPPYPLRATTLTSNSVLEGATRSSEGSTPPLGTSTTSNSSSNRLNHDVTTEKAISAIQIAIEDMRKAAQHGILTPPPEDAGKIKKTFHQAKELFKFYYRGLKLIWVHRKTVIEIKQRVKEEGGGMTRWEKQFIRTYEQDLVKLVPFVLILLVLEEVLPLVVLYLPGLLPSTCILPSQSDRIETKTEEKRKAAIVCLQSMLAQHNYIVPAEVASLDGESIKTICRVLSLASWGPIVMARNRLQRQLSYLADDDAALAQEGSGSHLTERELRHALSERGFLAREMQEIDLRPRLAGWLSDGGGINALISHTRRSI